MSTTSVSRQQQISSAQERLLALLEGPKAHVDAPPLTDLQACPKCGTPEFKTDMWCGGCGYCPKAGFDGAPLEDDSHQELDIWRIVPGWVWLMLGVELALIAGSFVFSWAIGGHYARTLVSLSLLGLGSLLVVVSHFRAYFATLSSTHCQGTFDIVMKPSTIWRAVFLGLPETSYLIASVVWGMTGMALSVCVIGGLDFMSIHQFVARDEPLETPTVGDLARVVVKGAAAVQTEGDQADMQAMMGDLQAAAAEAEGGGNGGPQDIESAVTQFADAAPMPEGEAGGAGVNEAGTDAENGVSAPNPDGEGNGDAQPAEGSLEARDEENGSSESEDDADTEAEAAESDIDTKTDTTGQPPNADAETADATDDEASPMSDVYANESVSDTEVQSLLDTLPPGDVVTCAIVGFTINSAGEPRSLLLAAPAGGNWHYVARLSIDDIPADVLADLTSRFPEHRSPRPLVACPFGGRWLTPDFYCDIHFPGSPTGPRLDEPTFIKMQSTP